MTEIGDAAALGLAVTLVGAVPTVVRCQQSGVSLLDGVIASIAVVGGLVLPVALISPRAARGFRGVLGGRSAPRALGLGLLIWAGLSFAGLFVLGSVLKAATHHRGLGGATFGVFGAAVVCGAGVVAARAVSAGRSWVERGAPRALVSVLVGAGLTLAVGALVLPIVRAQTPHPARAAIFDLLLLVVVSALLLPLRMPEALARPLRLVALPLALSLVVGSWYRVETSSGTRDVQRVGGLPSSVLWGLERWSDRDGDGVGAHFGGHDCDEGDPTRHPGASERADDGIDSDCDGQDGLTLAAARPVPAAPVVSAVARPPERSAPSVAPSAEPIAPAAPGRPDIVLITLDTTRADRCTPYGAPRDTTPTLARLAGQGLLVEHAYAAGSNTQRAVMPLVTGLPISRSPTTRKEWPKLEEEAFTVAERLKKVGYATAAVTSFTWLRKGRGMGQGFDSFDESPWRDNHPERKVTGAAAAAAARAAYAKLTEGEPPLFLWVHLFDPHEDYIRHAAHDFGKAPLDLYDGELAYTDAQLAALLAPIEASARPTVIIVHGSHGEAFGEHDKTGHGTDVYEEMIRVPLVIKGPGVKPRRFGGAAVSVSDIAPTVLDLAGAETTNTEGRTLFPLLGGGDVSGPIRSYAYRREAIIDWPLKVRVYRRPNKEPRLLLFDLAADPGESQDLSGERPEELKRLMALRRRDEG